MNEDYGEYGGDLSPVSWRTGARGKGGKDGHMLRRLSGLHLSW